MPTRPETKARYPANFDKEIAPAIRRRAGNRCEGSPTNPDCRLVNHSWIYRDNGRAVVVDAADVDRYPTKTGALKTKGRHRPTGRDVHMVILTVAHYPDPDPANCDPSNLHCWCQQCHHRHNPKWSPL